jgi:hypothetical protein
MSTTTMPILVFDTKGGLCNQFYDITNAINFCLKYNIFFTFRYCSFRNDNLTSWHNQPFEKLFDLTFLNKYNLYINYHSIQKDITNVNCFNFNGDQRAHIIFHDNDILNQLVNLNKKYIVLSQFWSLYKFRDYIDHTINNYIIPSPGLMNIYIKIKNDLIKNQPYNFIHYRYEIDFTLHFKITVDKLANLIENIKFKNNDLKIYIATSNIKNLLDLKDNKYKNILYKDDDSLLDLNFEERAFIDYMFGLNSVECYGHNKSSFSLTINNLKQTNNYYNLL